MPDTVHLPYTFLGDALDLEVLELKMDGVVKELQEIVDHHAHAINLTWEDAWRETVLELRVSDPNANLPKALHQGEQPNQSVRMMLVVTGQARTRGGYDLEPDGEGGWSATLSLSKENHAGSLAMKAVAVREADAKAVNGLAHRRGERLADSREWTLYIDEKVHVPGTAIPNEWRDFKNDELEELRRRSDSMWYLDQRQSDKPRLYLNEGVKGLRQALESEARRGAPASARENLINSILQPVLMQLCLAAILGIVESGEESFGGFHGNVLKLMASNLKGASIDEILDDWVGKWQAGDLLSVMGDVQLTVQRQLGVGDKAARLINDLDRSK